MSQANMDWTPAYDRHGKITPMVRSGGYVTYKSYSIKTAYRKSAAILEEEILSSCPAKP